SIRQSVNDLDRLAELHSTTVDCYGQAIRASGQYAIELDSGATAEYRSHLAALHEMLRTASNEEQFQAVQASFRGELREYRDKANEWLEKTRSDLKGAANAMQVLADGVASNGTGHEKTLKAELDKLVAVADSNDLSVMREVIRSAARIIAESYEQM